MIAVPFRCAVVDAKRVAHNVFPSWEQTGSRCSAALPAAPRPPAGTAGAAETAPAPTSGAVAGRSPASGRPLLGNGTRITRP
ncbi:hypothetical protein CNX65_09290 [Actinosynnema pretiosum]|uniref:Uncharacterized protein n=1 Tax=Actinosynnema pretiosum TaxID=42197 RepID=A0A290Z3A2_9PSEU|nr:hypothetical protein CNX65_09290 [Actinosynnema pretiosum]